MKIPKKLKAFIILTASLASFLAGYILIQSGLKPSVATQQKGTILDRFDTINDASATSLPAPDGLFQITETRTLSAVADHASNSVLYYHADTGAVSRVDVSTRQETLISPTVLNGLVRTIWSPDRSKVISVFSAPHGMAYKYFDYKSKRTTTLRGLILDAVFSPDGASIAFVRSAGDVASIIISAPDGSDERTLLQTRLHNISLAWPSSHTLSLTVTNSDGFSDVYSLSDTGELTKIIEAIPHLQLRWNHDGSSALYSTSSVTDSALTIYDSVSKKFRPVLLAATADVCEWTLNTQTIYCAVQDQGETSVVKIENKTGVSETIASNLLISPEYVFFSHLEDYLIFLSKADHGLYGLRINAL